MRWGMTIIHLNDTKGVIMTAKTEWLELKQRAMIMARSAQIDSFYDWTEVFIKEEAEKGNAFKDWLSLAPETRKSLLYDLINGEIVKFGDGPQFEGVMLASLFHVLTFGRCLVLTAMKLDGPAVRRVSRCLEELLDEPVKTIGSELTCVPSNTKFSDVVRTPLAIADYFLFACDLLVHAQNFQPGLPVMFLEIDTCLYRNRLMFFDQRRPQTTGMIFRANVDIVPLWRGSKNVFDTVVELRQLKLLVGGSVSYVDKGVAMELGKQLKDVTDKKVTSNFEQKFTAFTFRKNDERSRAILTDIMKCECDALVFYNDEDLGMKLASELRKGGMDVVIVKNTEEMTTVLQSQSGKRVILSDLQVSTLSACPEKLDKHVQIFIAELLLDESSFSKIVASVKRIAIVDKPPVFYFSNEDKLLSIYEEQGGFEKFYNIMDFTEKYDPWRQIRRVLAKLIISRVNEIRSDCLDDNMPIPATSMERYDVVFSNATNNNPSARVRKRNVNLTEGLCFCGSGKPFKECHGKPKAN